ncbi:MAG: HEPN domain-containing protein [Candidatus Hydrogenedentes bacterium]|nr:HEPN domain-containing protein [Candidatus Hydrogenedentota bacterium]
MPVEPPIPGTPSDWLSRAKGDFALACVTLPEGGFYEDLCYHLQQAAEKAIKAVYRVHGLTFRYTHDLEVLLDTLGENSVVIPDDVKLAADLTDYAWESRYPGLMEAVSYEEYLVAKEQAKQILAWAEAEVEEHESP